MNGSAQRSNRIFCWLIVTTDDVLTHGDGWAKYSVKVASRLKAISSYAHKGSYMQTIIADKTIL